MVCSLVEGGLISYTLDHQIILSLEKFPISTTKKLMIGYYAGTADSEMENSAALCPKTATIWGFPTPSPVDRGVNSSIASHWQCQSSPNQP